MYILNFYCLLVSILICLFGRYVGKNLAIRLNLVFLLFSLIISGLLFYECIMGSVVEVTLFTWISLVGFCIKFSFFYDFLSTSMLFLVVLISFLVHVFSFNYMDADPFKLRFFCYLSLFTMFMCLLVVSDSLLQFFFAWEGVGITSYLLINFWYTRYEANRAALKAIFINRFGDFGLYTGILLIVIFFKTSSISSINCLFSADEISVNYFITFLGNEIKLVPFIAAFLFLGVVGKSAQLGLHTWLPDAMEGPTPVSALLHAATMVTAGVYLLLRLSFFFEASGILVIIAFWGAMTAFVASTIGVFQNDIKKVIAYSTCSQLGYMVAACGLNNFIGAYFHLFNHAFFKALLFLGAGSLIHAIGDDQDLRKYGGYLTKLPVTYITFLIASGALGGLPFLSGFYSKDLILSWSLVMHSGLSKAVYFLLLLATFCTALYSIKIIYQVFYSTTRSSFSIYNKAFEGNLYIIFPIVFLSVFALVSGYFFSDLFVGYGNNFVLSINLEENYYNFLEYIQQWKKFLPNYFVIISVFFFAIVTNFYTQIVNFILQSFSLLSMCKNVYTFFNKKWFFDYFYYYITKSIMHLSYYVVFKNLDKGIFERFFVKSLVWHIIKVSNTIRFVQTGSITNYYMYIFYLFFMLGLIIILITTNTTSLLILFFFYNLLVFFNENN